jgi:hypothetical protein
VKGFKALGGLNLQIYRRDLYDNWGEKVTTTKITKSKTKKNIKKFVNHHYIESVFLVHHYIENHCLFSSSLLRKSEHRKE